jgi:hypothetical protein
MWLFVHVRSLVDFRSRFAVLIEWAFAYFTWRRRSRVILEIPAEPMPATQPSFVGRAVRVNGQHIDLAVAPLAAAPPEAPALHVIRS